jgi:hypothetical protein
VTVATAGRLIDRSVPDLWVEAIEILRANDAAILPC